VVVVASLYQPLVAQAEEAVLIQVEKLVQLEHQVKEMLAVIRLVLVVIMVLVAVAVLVVQDNLLTKVVLVE
jgi:hypothetical protein